MWRLATRSRFAAILSATMALALILGIFGGSFLLIQRTSHAKPGTVITFHGPRQLSAYISYDSNGVPDITASDYANAVAAWGYVSASQRLFQMYDQFVWTANATLSAHLGAGPADAYVASDELFATLDLTDQANTTYADASPQTQALLQDYAEGVNTWIASNPLPYEFTKLKITPSTWTPQDSMDVALVTADSLDLDTWITKITASALAGTSPQLAEALVPVAPSEPSMFDASGNLTSPAVFDSYNAYDGASTSSGGEAQTALYQPKQHVAPLQLTKVIHTLTHDQSVIPALAELAAGPASDNVAIAGAYTNTGKAIVGNDPHLFAQAPDLLFPTEMQLPNETISGFAIPGLPGYLSEEAAYSGGPTIATSVTFAEIDDSDVRLESLQSVPTTTCPSGQQANVDGKLQCATSRQVTIQVAGSQSTTLGILSVVHASIICPIVNPAFDGALDPIGQISLQSTTGSSSWTLDGLIGGGPLSGGGTYNPVTLATTHAALATAISHVSVGLNFVYGINANIGYSLSGLVPVRNSASEGQNGSGIVPGNSVAYEWTGFASPSQLPSAWNPPSGFIATANNRLTSGGLYLGNVYDMAFRAQQMYRTLSSDISSGQDISVDTIAALQLDVYSGAAAITIPALVAALQNGATLTAPEQADISTLTSWNDQITANSFPAAIYETLQAILTRDLAAPDTGCIIADGCAGTLYTFYSSDVFINQQYEAMYLQLVDPSLMTPDQRTTWILQALSETIQLLATNHITSWGDEHHLDLIHPFAQPGTPYFKATYAIGPAGGFPTGGAPDTINIGGWFTFIGDLASAPAQIDLQAAFDQDASQAVRIAYDLNNPSNTIGIFLTGVSGEPGPHYSDQTPLWVAGHTIPLWP